MIKRETRLYPMKGHDYVKVETRSIGRGNRGECNIQKQNAKCKKKRGVVSLEVVDRLASKSDEKERLDC